MTQLAQETPSRKLEIRVALGKTLGTLVERLFGPAAEAGGGLLSDQIGYWRAKNALRLALLWEEEVSKRGLDPDDLLSLPFGDAYRVLEAATLESDEEVRELWAKLLASAMDPNRRVKVEKAYVDLLTSMGPTEAALMNVLWDIHRREPLDQDDAMLRDEIDELSERAWRRFYADKQALAIQNLIRLRCITPRLPKTGKFILGRSEFDPDMERHLLKVDPRALMSLFARLHDRINVAAGLLEDFGSSGLEASQDTIDDQPLELQFALTTLGLALMQSCAGVERPA